MTIRECYDAMGGNYADVEGRLRTEERIKKFVDRKSTRLNSSHP